MDWFEVVATVRRDEIEVSRCKDVDDDGAAAATSLLRLCWLDVRQYDFDKKVGQCLNLSLLFTRGLPL